jgi:hypothetical protein
MQIELGKLVALCCIDFLNETSDERAFEQLAIVSLAQAKGVKEAKKRHLSLSRWSKSCPPNLTTLQCDLEKMEVVKRFRTVNSVWAADYICGQLKRDELSQPVSETLLNWGRSACGDCAEFLSTVATHYIESSRDLKIATSRLKVCAKLLFPYLDADQNAISSACGDLEELSLRLLAGSTADIKSKTAFLQTVLAIYKDFALHIPTLTLHPVFLTSLENITEVLKSQKKLPLNFHDYYVHVILSLLTDMSYRDFPIRNYVGDLLPIWKQTFPNFDKIAKVASAKSPGLKRCLTSSAISNGMETRQIDGADAAFTNLLIAWEAYELEHAEDADVSHLSRLIQQAALTANIECFGAIGATEMFDPVSHKLAGSEHKTPTQVKILRSGVRIRRTDGSVRVLVPAFVEVK